MKLTLFGVSYSSKVTPRGQITDLGLDVIDLEVRDRWATDRGLSTPNLQLRPLAGAEPQLNGVSSRRVRPSCSA
jgi:hypothetical protein